MSVYYESTVLRAGNEAGDMVEGGVVILYADPIPDALESVSVVHGPAKGPEREIRPGDVFSLGEQRVELVAVGERAHENLCTLGHIVVYLNPDEGTSLLPGAVHGRGTVTVPAAGVRLALSGAAS
ncbi:PTS system glucitol/sorbitol-specific IIA component [Saccharomonospora amisosensis]|uniref:PTS system glucitol/sorbitol-specific IIA component n=1 Tax=Saccharomonospora amisosensis TaxID=1128677 RepID=A0A7X5USQ6_9PSEU|nr:PTS glucitol/sorbitol transporter subunit IIA [Saccharomonospora amisosensis]NIJ13490.1 PTS system glucitol/sorbitol-specific IIA component [Saccharomonospora amisosensis]